MRDRYTEKTFLYLVGLSLLLHLGVGIGLYYYPQSPPGPPKEPVFIDLQETPQPMQPAERKRPETRRRSEQHVVAPRESAPRGDAPHDIPAMIKPAPPSPAQPSLSQPVPAPPATAPGYSASSLLKQKNPAEQRPPSAQHLFPGANRMAKLEESYRRKFEENIAVGDTRFLNSDDIVFGSFLRRFEGAVYGVWRYPQEAAIKGIEGITPIRITFNRRGEVTNVQQLESSGSRILDEEVIRTMRAIGPVGGFPKGYDKDEFHLIAFFQYGGSRRSLR
jgi:periplasmic protein TonB